MRVIIGGNIQDCKPDSYTNRDGQTVETFEAFIGEGRFYDRIAGPRELMPVNGEQVEFIALVSAKTSKAGKAYLNVWCVERREAAKPVPVKAAS
jgi:hypothetical protein